MYNVKVARVAPEKSEVSPICHTFIRDNDKETVMESKVCSGAGSCGLEKSIEDFGVRSRSKDGRYGICRECRNKRLRDRYNTPHGKALTKVSYKKYADSDKGKATKGAYNQTEKAKESKRQCSMRYRQTEDGKNKRNARQKVATMLRYGHITKPSTCSRCGIGNSRLEAHHHSYEPKYHKDIVWLCVKCHKLAHIQQA